MCRRNRQVVVTPVITSYTTKDHTDIYSQQHLQQLPQQDMVQHPLPPHSCCGRRARRGCGRPRRHHQPILISLAKSAYNAYKTSKNKNVVPEQPTYNSGSHPRALYSRGLNDQEIADAAAREESGAKRVRESRLVSVVEGPPPAYEESAGGLEGRFAGLSVDGGPTGAGADGSTGADGGGDGARGVADDEDGEWEYWPEAYATLSEPGPKRSHATLGN